MNKIIALWTHPRSLSTAFCMLTKQRSNLEVIIEPFKYMYYKDYYLKDDEVLKEYEDKKVFITYEDVIESLYRLSKKQDVLFKDMAYFVDDKLSSKELKNYINIFLIRDPKKSIPSLHYIYKKNKLGNITNKDSGYEAVYNIYSQCKNVCNPLVINADDLVYNTEKIIRRFELYTRLTQCDTSSWDEKDNPVFHQKSSKIFHVNTAKTNKFTNLSSNYKETVKNNASLKKVYEYSLKYYEKLINEDYNQSFEQTF